MKGSSTSPDLITAPSILLNRGRETAANVARNIDHDFCDRDASIHPSTKGSTKFCAPLKIGLRREGLKSELSARCHKRIPVKAMILILS